MSNETEWVMVPREPTEAMLSSAHYELADKPFSNNAERSARAYAAMLDAAPQPPAEAQPDGGVGEFGVGIQPNPKARYWQERAEFWKARAVALGWREKRDAANGETPPAEADPFVVRHYIGEEGPTIKGNGFDGLRLGEGREEAEEFVRWINARLAQQPAPSAPAQGAPPALTPQQAHELVPDGFSWDEAGAWAMGYEACRQRALAQQPAAVDGVNWRDMYRLQTAMRYMDNNAQLTKERAYRMADNDVAALAAQQGGGK